jgi:hypothetical protein
MGSLVEARVTLVELALPLMLFGFRLEIVVGFYHSETIDYLDNALSQLILTR